MTGAFLAPLAQTLWLLLVGYVAACILGVLIGLLVGRSERAFCLLEPLIEAIRPLPKPALIPIFFLFLGPGSTMKITMVALAAFFPVLINTLQGVRGVDRVLLDTAKTLGLSSFSLVRKVILPAALPLILSGMRVSLGLGLVLVVVAEMLEADSGVGFQVLDLQRAFRVKEMYSWIFVLAVVGLSLNSAFEWGEKRLTPWHSR
jgi:ABC-type nitrate/sulfonate/bicarbonate transport system permease component